MTSAGALDHLYTMKFQKIKEQKALSDRMHDMLSKSGGLNESSKMALKNLQAAITVSKRPGYFDYYVPPDEIKSAEEKKVLNSLAKSIAKVHKELEQINEEIEQTTAQLHPKPIEPPSVTSLNQWFDIYGKPQLTDEKRDMMTKFEKDSKIYGGTAHYKSFKTTSTIMVKGRIAVKER